MRANIEQVEYNRFQTPVGSPTRRNICFEFRACSEEPASLWCLLDVLELMCRAKNSRILDDENREVLLEA
jgi:hypothetical protein